MTTPNPNDQQPTHGQQLYTDHYFARGHWGLKIWQTIVALLGWVCVFVPIWITVKSFLGVHGHGRPIWRYAEGIYEIKFIGIILFFLASVALIFTVTMTIIQVRKRDRLVAQWPTFNPVRQKRRVTTLDQFMDKRFGPATVRMAQRNYTVQPDQNLDTDQIHDLFEAAKLDDMNQSK